MKEERREGCEGCEKAVTVSPRHPFTLSPPHQMERRLLGGELAEVETLGLARGRLWAAPLLRRLDGDRAEEVGEPLVALLFGGRFQEGVFLGSLHDKPRYTSRRWRIRMTMIRRIPSSIRWIMR